MLLHCAHHCHASIFNKTSNYKLHKNLHLTASARTCQPCCMPVRRVASGLIDVSATGRTAVGQAPLQDTHGVEAFILSEGIEIWKRLLGLQVAASVALDIVHVIDGHAQPTASYVSDGDGR